MKITDACIACGKCVPYCPVGAISVEDPILVINQDKCVECGACKRSEVCPVDAFEEEKRDWPRSVRGAFSNPLLVHKETRVPGRGTEEMKTNDLRGLYGNGIVGFTAEMGRPGVSTDFRDVEKVAMAMAKVGLMFAPDNPVTANMTDVKTGKLNPELYDERALSAMIEGRLKIEDLPRAIEALKEVEKELNTVFSLDVIDMPEADGSVPAEKVLREIGQPFYPNGKNNFGLGRPLATKYGKDREES